jgi:frizzled 4
LFLEIKVILQALRPIMCPQVLQPIGPCRKLCESVRSRCYPVLQSFGLPWPAGLQCNKFPRENNHEQMCMDGPSDPESELDAVDEPTTLPPPPARQPTQPFTQTSGCAHLARRESYIYVNRTTAYCAPR